MSINMSNQFKRGQDAALRQLIRNFGIDAFGRFAGGADKADVETGLPRAPQGTGPGRRRGGQHAAVAGGGYRWLRRSLTRRADGQSTCILTASMPGQKACRCSARWMRAVAGRSRGVSTFDCSIAANSEQRLLLTGRPRSFGGSASRRWTRLWCRSVFQVPERPQSGSRPCSRTRSKVRCTQRPVTGSAIRSTLERPDLAGCRRSR